VSFDATFDRKQEGGWAWGVCRGGARADSSVHREPYTFKGDKPC
jgi:hypothetical protein